MDLSSVGKMASPWLKVMNDTSQPANSSTTFPGILDSVLTTAGQASPLLQLFLFIYKLVGAQLGLDPSILLTCLGCLWGLSKLFDQVWAIIDNFITGHLRCTVCVTEDDQIYNTLMQFLSEQQDIATNRHLTAQTVYKSAWDEEEDSTDALATTMVEDNQDSPKYLNFASDAARCVSLFYQEFNFKDTDKHRIHDTSRLWAPPDSGITEHFSECTAERKLCRTPVDGEEWPRTSKSLRFPASEDRLVSLTASLRT